MNPIQDPATSRPVPEGGPPNFAHGARYEGDDPELMALAIEAAFDYRGDVTLTLKSGAELKGYLANRRREGGEPQIELFPADGGAKRKIPYRDLRAIAFSGRDTAEGKSWVTWLKKYKEKKEAEARGEKTGTIGLFPDSLD